MVLAMSKFKTSEQPPKQNPNTPSIWRQATVCYIASLVARAKFVDLGTTKMCLRQLMEWIHKYIAARYHLTIYKMQPM